MEEIKDSMEKCLEIISLYSGKLYIDEMYISQEQWMLKVSINDNQKKSQMSQESEGKGLR